MPKSSAVSHCRQHLPAPNWPLARHAHGQLRRLQSLMAGEGMSLQTTRMHYDRLYALDRLALAHTSASAELRECALSMFPLFEPGAASDPAAH